MTDETKELIWELVESQFEIYDRMNLPIERKILENKVLDLIQTIEDEEDADIASCTTNAWDDGWDVGHQSASEEIGDLREIMRNATESLKEVIDVLYNEGYRY